MAIDWSSTNPMIVGRTVWLLSAEERSVFLVYIYFLLPATDPVFVCLAGTVCERHSLSSVIYYKLAANCAWWDVWSRRSASAHLFCSVLFFFVSFFFLFLATLGEHLHGPWRCLFVCLFVCSFVRFFITLHCPWLFECPVCDLETPTERRWNIYKLNNSIIRFQWISSTSITPRQSTDRFGDTFHDLIYNLGQKCWSRQLLKTGLQDLGQ